MKKKHLTLAVAGVVVVISAGLIFAGTSTEGQNARGFTFTYTDANKDLQLLLVESDIHMSSPLKLNGFSIEKYCTFFSDPAIQKSIQYCTSTEILDSNRGFLGNIQMVGSPQKPEYVIAAIQTDSMMSRSDDLKTIVQTMIDTLVCSCWEAESPGGFATVSDWIDAAHTHHIGGTSNTSKSEIWGLAGNHLLLEITTNNEGYLWKVVISK